MIDNVVRVIGSITAATTGLAFHPPRVLRQFQALHLRLSHISSRWIVVSRQYQNGFCSASGGLIKTRILYKFLCVWYCINIRGYGDYALHGFFLHYLYRLAGTELPGVNICFLFIVPVSTSSSGREAKRRITFVGMASVTPRNTAQQNNSGNVT